MTRVSGRHSERGDEHGGEDGADDDGRRHVARWAPRSCGPVLPGARRAAGRRGAGRRAARGSTGAAGRVGRADGMRPAGGAPRGAARDPPTIVGAAGGRPGRSARPELAARPPHGRDPPRRSGPIEAGTASRSRDGVAPLDAARLDAAVGSRPVVVPPHRRLGGERRPHVDLVVLVARRRRPAGRRAGPRRWADRSSAAAARCRWGRSAAVAPPCPSLVASSPGGGVGRIVREQRSTEFAASRSSLAPSPVSSVIRRPRPSSPRAFLAGRQTSSSSASLRLSARVDVLDVLVGDLLHLLLGPLQLVGRDLARLLRGSELLRASRRRLRTATRPSSAMFFTTLTYSLRRSSVSGGKIAGSPYRRCSGRHPGRSRDRPLDGAQRGAVVRLDEQLTGLGHLDAGELQHRDLGAEYSTVKPLDQRRAMPARSAPSGTASARGRRPCPSSRWLRAGSPRSRGPA